MSETHSDGSGPRPNGPIVFRPATEGDIDSIAALHARSWRENYRDDFTPDYLDGDLVAERHAVWTERIRRPAPNQRVQLALRGDDLVGFVCVDAAHDPTWGSFVDNLHMLRESKVMGIGAENSEIVTMETHGAAMVRSGRYTWAVPSTIAAGRDSGRRSEDDA